MAHSDILPAPGSKEILSFLTIVLLSQWITHCSVVPCSGLPPPVEEGRLTPDLPFKKGWVTCWLVATPSEVHSSTLWMGRRLQRGTSLGRKRILPFSNYKVILSLQKAFFPLKFRKKLFWSHASKSCGKWGELVLKAKDICPMLILHSSYLFARSELISQL